MHIEEILSRLTKVKKTGPGKWIAVCPAHEDRSPSLAIKEHEGKVLIHCFASCSVADVCGAIGVELSDLFPPSDKREWLEGREKPLVFGATRFLAIDALRCLSSEGSVLAICAADIAEGKVLGPEMTERLYLACDRIATALDYVENT